MNIYIVRHGQTDWNKEGKFQGSCDIELNKTGEEEAKKLKEELKGIKFDLIISSPLKRAIKTAKIINESHGTKIEISKDIIERDFGELEGKSAIEQHEINMEMLLNIDYNYNKKKVEPIKELQNRVYKFLHEIAKRHFENILIVSHCGVIQMMRCYFEGVPKDKNILKLSIGNCEYKTYEIEGETNGKQI